VRGSSKKQSWSEVYDRRDVWVGLKPTARLRANRSRQGQKESPSKEAEEKTLLSDWRSLLKKCLTGPTLLEMSGNAAFMVVVGAHCLPFIHLYGMWQFGVLPGLLIGGGIVIGTYLPSGGMVYFDSAAGLFIHWTKCGAGTE
jgi:hypothetical protein